MMQCRWCSKPSAQLDGKVTVPPLAACPPSICAICAKIFKNIQMLVSNTFQIFEQNYSISDPGYKYLLAICAKSVNPARIFKCWSGYKYCAWNVPLANMCEGKTDEKHNHSNNESNLSYLLPTNIKYARSWGFSVSGSSYSLWIISYPSQDCVGSFWFVHFCVMSLPSFRKL